MSNNSLDENTIKLFGMKEGKWQILNTEMSAKDDFIFYPCCV